MRRVVFTAPHFSCMWKGMPREDMRCEPETKKAIEAAQEVVRRCGLATKAVYGDVFRELVDLNRPEGRGTEFRDKVERELTWDTLVLDMHTSPPSAFDDGTDIMVLVSGRGRNRALAEDLAERLRAEGLNIELKPASRVNDIVEQSHDESAGAALLEFNPGKDIEASARAVGRVLCEGR